MLNDAAAYCGDAGGYGIAEPQPERRGRACALDRQFDQADAVVVPERLPRRRLCEDARVSQAAARDFEFPVVREAARAQARHRIAVVIDVDHLRQVAGGEPHVQAVHRPHARRRKFSPCKRRGDRREQVAGVEGSRKPGRPPAHLPGLGAGGARREHREQSVVGSDEPLVIGAHERRRARAAHPGIDHTDEDRSGGERRVQRGEQMGAGRDVEPWCLVQQIDERGARRGLAHERGLQLPDIGVERAEIGEQHDHGRHYRALALPASGHTVALAWYLSQALW